MNKEQRAGARKRGGHVRAHARTLTEPQPDSANQPTVFTRWSSIYEVRRRCGGND